MSSGYKQTQFPLVKKININDENYALESKTTGLIHWWNVNCYHNKTKDYKSKNYKDEYEFDDDELEALS